MSSILLLLASLNTAEAYIKVTPRSAQIGHTHHAQCSHRPAPHPAGKWVWVPGKVYRVVKFGRIRYKQGPGHWKLVPRK